MTITSRSSQLPTAETLSFDFAANGDTSIFVTYPDNSSAPDHRILYVSNRWLVTSNVNAKPGFEIDAFNGPMLTMQLVTKFLDHAFPQGPSNLKKIETVDVTEEFRPIRVNTISAQGGWDAPWRLVGTLEPRTEGAVSYDFVVLHSAAGDREVHKIEFSGEWVSKTNSRILPNSMSLRGWKVYSLGTRKNNDGSPGEEFVAEEQSLHYATLGDLRGVATSKSNNAETPARKPPIPASLSSPLQRY